MNANAFTVIDKTAILGAVEFVCHWQIDAGACPSATVTVFHSADIDGTTYGENYQPFTFFIYPDGWGITFVYSTVGVIVTDSYHTASIVDVSLNPEY